jgi:hypothetical protein
MGNEKQARKLERGLEIELQRGRSRHSRSSSPFSGVYGSVARHGEKVGIKRV